MNSQQSMSFAALNCLDVCERHKGAQVYRDEKTGYMVACLQLRTAYEAEQFHELLRGLMSGKTLDDAIAQMRATELVAL